MDGRKEGFEWWLVAAWDDLVLLLGWLVLASRTQGTKCWAALQRTEPSSLSRHRSRVRPYLLYYRFTSQQELRSLEVTTTILFFCSSEDTPLASYTVEQYEPLY